jgi:hypothetical protein
MNHEETIKRLREPFTSKEIEWKIQVTMQDKARGMAVAYMDARAVQKRLDEVVGPFNWKNFYSLWHDNAQICGISIFNAERNEWVAKWDGAENSDIEPIKGGLSDSFKRAATAWGIGRYLYELDGIWVDVEAKGKSSVIKQNQYARLESEYNAAVNKIFGSAPKQQGSPVGISNKQTSAPAVSQNTKAEQPPKEAAFEYKVKTVNPSGRTSQVLELIDSGGRVTKAFIKNADQSIKTGTCLNNVQIERRNSNVGEYNLINAYQLAA